MQHGLTRQHAATAMTLARLQAAWLASECGGTTIKPLKEGEDATAAVTQLLGAVKALHFAVPPHFTAQKLQSGMGPEVCGVLEGLADLALEATGFQFQPVQQVAEDADGCALSAPAPRMHAPL